MSGNDIRKYLDIITTGTSEVSKSILVEGFEADAKDWFLDSTNKMIARVRSGEYPIDVINELAREYSWEHGGSYESFTFARDALDRRAWEMGLRYNEDETDPLNSPVKTDTHLPEPEQEDDFNMHSTELDPSFISSLGQETTPDYDDELVQEGWLDDIVKKVAPEFAAEREGKQETASLNKELMLSFKKYLGQIGGVNKLNKKSLEKFLANTIYDPKFIQDSIKTFKEEFPGVDFDVEVKVDDLRKLFGTIAANAMAEGGKAKVAKGKYGSTNSSDDSEDSEPEQSEDGESKDPKMKKLTSMDSINAIKNKLLKGQVSDLSPEEVRDLGLMMQKYAIPAIQKAIKAK